MISEKCMMYFCFAVIIVETNRYLLIIFMKQSSVGASLSSRMCRSLSDIFRGGKEEAKRHILYWRFVMLSAFLRFYAVLLSTSFVSYAVRKGGDIKFDILFKRVSQCFFLCSLRGWRQVQVSISERPYPNIIMAIRAKVFLGKKNSQKYQ